MKVVFSIIDNKTKYGSVSISGYRKTDLIKTFEKVLLAGDNYGSLYFGSELIMSGYYNEFWKVCLTFSVEYVNILLPGIPKFMYENYKKFKSIEMQYKKIVKKDNSKTLLDLRNSIVVQSITMSVVKTLQSARKQHISVYIPKSYNDQVKIILNDIRNAQRYFEMFKKVLKIVISNKIKNIGNDQKIISTLFGIIGKLLSIDCDSVTNKDNNYNIVLYTHSRSKINERIMGLLWKIILQNSKFDREILRNIIFLIKIYELHILQKTEKQSYIMLSIMLYYIYAVDFKLPPMPSLEHADMNKVKGFYSNVQFAISKDTRRKDFIQINNNKIKKKSNTKIKERTNKIIPQQSAHNIMSSHNIGDTMKVTPTHTLPMVKNVSYSGTEGHSNKNFVEIKNEILNSIEEVDDDYFIKSSLLDLMDNAREVIEGISITKTNDNEENIQHEENERIIEQTIDQMRDEIFFDIDLDEYPITNNEKSPDNNFKDDYKEINLTKNNEAIVAASRLSAGENLRITKD